MIKVLVEKITPRIHYTFDFIFSQRNIDFELMTGEGDSSQCTFAYLRDQHPSIPTICMSEIMLDEHVRRLDVDVARSSSVECLQFFGKKDVIASIFFVLCRYEEYTSLEKDEHDRFPFSESVTAREWGMYAICDRWSEYVLHQFSIPFSINGRCTIVPTFDIDNTYAYALKRGARRVMSVLKDLISLNLVRFKERRAVLKKQMKDPYDTFEMIEEIALRFPETVVFWLVGKWGKKDRNISISDPSHQALIQKLARRIDLGLHPSYASFQNEKEVEKERLELEAVLDKKIERSRQHFLRFRLPLSYQLLSRLGFQREYSMGFSDRPGFRCGTARPHPWFDLERNEISSLIVHPFVYMDGTFCEHMELSVEQSKKVIDSLHREVCRFGGDFTFIWHNETIGDYGKWKGWREVLEYTLHLNDD